MAEASEAASPGAARERRRRAERHADRDRFVEPGWTLPAHLTKSLGLAAVILAAGVWLVQDASAWHWACVPAFVVAANIVEWAFHRGPMHRPMWPPILYKKHTLWHHHAFEPGDMAVRSLHELSIVMMPWYTLLAVFVMALPVAALAWLVGGPALAGVFFVTAIAYFALYETLHTLYHLPTTTLERLGLARSALFMALRGHHAQHHRLGRMARINFNVTFPLADALFATRERPADAARTLDSEGDGGEP